MEKYVVLLSAGLDSATNLYAAHKNGQVLLALNFNYGQRAAKAELRQSKILAEKLNIPFKSIELPFFSDFSKSSLTDKSKDLAVNVKIDDLDASQISAKNVWVANRNGIFLNIAAAYAESLGADFVVPGFNIEEAATFPDNSNDYLNAASNSLFYSTSNHVKVKCFSIDKNKIAIVKYAKELGLDLDLVWSCYQDQEKMCGICESCLRFQRAIKEA